MAARAGSMKLVKMQKMKKMKRRARVVVRGRAVFGELVIGRKLSDISDLRQNCRNIVVETGITRAEFYIKQ